MKGIENIVGKVEAGAQATAAETAAAAVAKAAQLLDDAKAAGEKAAADIMRKAAQGAQDIARRADSMMNLEGRKKLLGERQKLIEEAFEAAAAKLAAMAEEPAGYVKILESLAKDAAPQSTLLLAKADFDGVGKALAKATGLAVEPAQLPRGGLVVRQGEVEINLTFAALLRQYREELERDVAAALFN
ncbi:MAG TPA: V-type ATP synthase subunit E family protein [Candidatus Acidoferrum sp.]|nr:V-type ATP synthase subunit E family protein [Candidatus Acidoferrum sp.]